MTPEQWLTHAAKCREVAFAMTDEAARRVLLEAADEYEMSARREQRVRNLAIPAFHVDSQMRRQAVRVG